MDFWLSFWATLMIATHTAFASNGTCQPENGTLTVSHSPFKNLSDYYCSKNYSNVHTIRLFNNSLSSLDAGVFSGVSGLIHLSVVQNLLEYLDPNLLSNLKELISLDLSYNRLTSLNNSKLFIAQIKLEVLGLSYNQITSLDVSVLAPLRSLLKLDLTENPISCNCEIRRAVKSCEERNRNISVNCDEELSGIELRHENCTRSHTERSSSTTLILTGIGLVIVLLAVAIVSVKVYCLRKASRADTVGNENETSLETSASHDIIFYRVTPNNIEQQNNSDYCKVTLPRNASDIHSSPQYEELSMQQCLYDVGTSSNLGTINEVTVAADSTSTYAEPFEYTTKTSEIYAVPYDDSIHNREKNGILHENVLHSKSNNGIPSSEVSVRNSLYSSS